jgi:hypothetical protein
MSQSSYRSVDENSLSSFMYNVGTKGSIESTHKKIIIDVVDDSVLFPEDKNTRIFAQQSMLSKIIKVDMACGADAKEVGQVGKAKEAKDIPTTSTFSCKRRRIIMPRGGVINIGAEHCSVIPGFTSGDGGRTRDMSMNLKHRI